MTQYRSTVNATIRAYEEPFENKGEVIANPETGELFFTEDVRWAERNKANGASEDVWELAYRRFYRFPYKIPESLEDAQALLTRVRTEINGPTPPDPTIGPILDLINFILMNKAGV